MHRVLLVLRRSPGTRFDLVPLPDLIHSVVSGAAVGVSDVRIGSVVGENIGVSFFWAGRLLPEIRANYLARFGLSLVETVARRHSV